MCSQIRLRLMGCINFCPVSRFSQVMTIRLLLHELSIRLATAAVQLALRGALHEVLL